MSCLKKIIEERDRIMITGHINPDGDAIGAGLALLLGLKKLYPNKQIEFVLQDVIPNHIKFLKSTSKIKNIENRELEDYDLVIFVDSANPERVGKVRDLVKNAFIVNIDHHISNTLYGDWNRVQNISSTSEIIFNLLQEDLNIKIDLEMGEAIYLGLINDTGNFSHSNVTYKTLEIASQLLKIGVNNNYLINNFLKSKSYARIKLLGLALLNMVYEKNKKLVYYYLPYKQMIEIGATNEDTEGLVEELLSYCESEVSLFIREEKNGRIKGSLRSKNNIDVNRLASLFNGGGHIKAAGFTTDLTFSKIIDKIKENL